MKWVTVEIRVPAVLVRIVCWFLGHKPEATGGIYVNAAHYPYTRRLGDIITCVRCDKQLTTESEIVAMQGREQCS